MAVKHCLRRRAEAREPPRTSHDRAPIPVYPFCATECETGGALAARFGDVQSAPLRVNGLGVASRPPPPTEGELIRKLDPEETMPKGKRSAPMACCGSWGSRHLAACTVGKKTGAEPKQERVVRKPIAVTVTALPPLSEYPVERLVELQHQVVAELRARRDRAKAEALAIDEALGNVEAA